MDEFSSVVILIPVRINNNTVWIFVYQPIYQNRILG